jgi:CelD/BcsL family acetyltransferase involved in cellulose biosynthesis
MAESLSDQRVQVRHIRTLEEFSAIREDWSNLLEKRLLQTAFLTWEWMFTWWKHYGTEKDLWLITAWKDEQLIGGAPLMLSRVSRLGLTYRILQSLGKPNTDESDFITVKESSEEIIRCLVEYISSQQHQWDALELCEFNPESHTSQVVFDEITKLNLHSIEKREPHYQILLSRPWEEYWKSLSKNTRDSIEKRYKQGVKKMDLQFQYINAAQVTWQHFETIFEINETARYPEKYGSTKERAFLADLVSTMNGKGWLEVIFLHMDGKPIAYDYGFNMNGKFEDWRTGYNLNYSSQAAGKVLLYLLIKHQFENGYKIFDFLRGAYEYKTQWNPDGRDFQTIIVVKPFHIPARLALITLPKMWDWFKRNILKRRPV